MAAAATAAAAILVKRCVTTVYSFCRLFPGVPGPTTKSDKGLTTDPKFWGLGPPALTSFLAVPCQGDGTAGLANPGRGDPAKEWFAGLHAIHARRPIPTCPIRLVIPGLANDGLPLRRENGRHRLSRGGCRFRERAVLFGSRLAIAAAYERGACAGFGAGSRSDPDIAEGDLLPAG
jgi:hypothetical protein